MGSKIRSAIALVGLLGGFYGAAYVFDKVSNSSSLLAASAPPRFKVWVDQPFIESRGVLDRNVVALNLQSLEDQAISVTRVLVNDDPNCLNQTQPQSFEQPMKIGQTLKYSLGLRGLGACDVVKVLISTDRGDAIYRFN
ncbi:hypothetical protein [Bradyrhizobium sp. CCGUVB23]|uniref:hypothetical protein n=1 Tax=Bradyrhizobium sp. CCGUVB23 TaxID=2949630 RepID=UPI0020B31A29|nr:hypothetical protein [Bradyrhizobium sp. CCGUVB23]MCP3462133.1 hypothetical protein [Bradyrhizobium sp. CCGUVB23]